MVASLWSGVLQSVHVDSRFRAIAHGQEVSVPGLNVVDDRKVMVYDWRIASVDPTVLIAMDKSQSVLIPPDEEINYTTLCSRNFAQALDALG